MKKLLLIGLLFFCINSFCQVEGNSIIKEKSENIKKDIEIKIIIDSTVYAIKQGNSYYTKDQKSAIEAKLILMSFEKMNTNMQMNVSENIDKGSTVINGVNVLFIKKFSKNKENIILIYSKKNDDNSSISFVSFYPTERENYYKPIIEKAFLSAIINK